MLFLENADAKLLPRLFSTVFNDSPSASHRCHSFWGKVIDFEDRIVNSIFLLLVGGPVGYAYEVTAKPLFTNAGRTTSVILRIYPADVDHFITFIAGYVSL